MLAHTADEDRLRPGDLAEPRDHVLRRDVPVVRLGVPERERLTPVVDLLPPALQVGLAVLGVLTGELGQQIGEHLLEVPDDRHVGAPVLADLRRVDVRVHDGGVRGERRQLAGDPVVEACAERDDQVGLLQRCHGSDGPVHAGHAQVLRVRVGQRTASHQGGHRGGAGRVHEPTQVGRRAGTDHAPTDQDHGATRGREQPGGLANLLGMRLGHRVVPGQVELLGPGERGVGDLGRLRDVHQDRAGPAGRGDVERRGDGAGDVRGVGHQEAVLGDRQRDADDVGLLERVGADQGWPAPGR